MKAPDKIYLHGYDFDYEPCKTWEREPKVKGMRGYPAIHVEYIRKDALMEMLNKKLQESADRLDFHANQAYAEVIDKLNSL